jgi:hypothetical protein
MEAVKSIEKYQESFAEIASDDEGKEKNSIYKLPNKLP